MTKAQLAEQEDAQKQLREMIPPGSTVYTTLVHVSRSGMYRVVDVFVLKANDAGECEPLRISFQTAKAIGGKYDRRHEGVGVGGCGMDMGFAVVHDLSYYLYPKGFGCVGERCPSNDHSNGDRDYTAHPGSGTPDARGTRDHWHNSGGYALKHRWM